MNRRLLPRLAIFVALILAALAPALRAEVGEEAGLIEILNGNYSLQDKAVACARLERIGTAASVPALAALLTDDQLSHSARFALEPMPTLEAGKALLAALLKTSGSNQVGIIHSLAMRYQTEAAPQLDKLLASGDASIAQAAAEALGRIAGVDDVPALQSAAANSTGALHAVQIDALLASANRFIGQNHQDAATKVFQAICDGEKNDEARLAGFRGLIMTSGARGLALIVDAIAGTDAAKQGAALRMAVMMRGTQATAALADLLEKVQPPVQMALLQCLGQREDPAAVGPVAKLADSQDADVRVAAISALGDLGDGAVAVLLAQKAASAAGAEKELAREALRNLRHGEVTSTMLDALGGATPLEAQLELISALGVRADPAALPKLLDLTQSPTAAVRATAFQALASLAGPPQIATVVTLVLNAKTPDFRAQAADALAAICQRRQSKLTPADIQPLLDAAAGKQAAPLEARLALLGVCGELTGAMGRDALRAGLEDQRPEVRDTALRALADTHDPALLPDLLNIAVHSNDKKSRLLAVRACARLVTQEEGIKLTSAQKLDVCKQILATPLDDSEKRLILSALGTVPDEQALTLATPMLDDPAVNAEAAQAVIRIAPAIAADYPTEAGAALKRVLTMSTTLETRQAAEAALKKIK